MKTTIGSIISVSTISEIPQDLENRSMVYVTGTNEIYIKNNNNLILMQSAQQSEPVSYEKLKILVREVLREDEEISELKQLFVNCLAQAFENYTDNPESLLNEMFTKMSGISIPSIASELFNMNSMVRSLEYQTERMITSLSVKNEELERRVQFLQNEICQLSAKIEELKHKL